MALMGVISLGLSTTVHPANKAGPIYYLRESLSFYALSYLSINSYSLYRTACILFSQTLCYLHTDPATHYLKKFVWISCV